jgi:hypothetical protein
MKVFLFCRVLLLVLCLLICASARAQSGDSNSLLTNASIVKLVKAGFKEKSIITIIGARPVKFDLTTDRLIELKRTGVSEKVILAMMARQEGMDISDEVWTDDETFFKQSTDAARNPSGSSTKPANGNSNDGNSVDIFGSSGGSKGSTRSRGGSNSGADDTITTGSATVRILRPPTEAGGGGPAKLEKTQSLTNDSVCELVEAGFSEGTIIRRIENSPVEFDLSAAKVEELRKRRVSEKIISAMKAAMGDESTK